MGARKGKLNKCIAIYEDRIENLFQNLGSFLSKHPKKNADMLYYSKHTAGIRYAEHKIPI